ncbi:ATP-binding protein [Micrococcus luteus]
MKWSSDDLLATLEALRVRRGDTTNVEVKRAAGGVPQLAETLCAFANMPEGGTIILGVDEARGAFNVTGVVDVALLEAGVAAQAREGVTPSPQIIPQTLQVDERQVLLIHVVPLRTADKPATVQGVAYLRQSDGDYRMHEHELRMLEVAKLHADERVDYELKVATGLGEQDLVSSLVDEYVAAVRRKNRRLRDRTSEEILRQTSVLTSSGEPTLAGLYTLGDFPQGRFPGLTVTAAVQLPGGEGQPRNRNLEDFVGPLPDLLSDLMAWVSDNIDTVRRYRRDGHMEEVAELPLTAVRELLANALVHRDLGPSTLGMGKGIQVRLTPRNLFIQNPGGLQGLSLTQLQSDDHAQAAVNQRLYQIAKKLTTSDGASLIEGEGGGIREVFRGAERQGLPRPQLIDTGVQFKAILWRAADRNARAGVEDAKGASAVETAVPRAVPASTSPTRHEHAVLAALVRMPDGATLRALTSATGLTDRQVRYALRLPLDEGIVVMDGGQGNRQTAYRLMSDSRRP